MRVAEIIVEWSAWLPSWSIAGPQVVLPALLLAWVCDALFGEPPTRLHPVVWLGKGVQYLQPWLLRGHRNRQLLAGGLVASVLPLGFGSLAWASLWLARNNYLLQLLVASYWINSSFALRGLAIAARGVTRPLWHGDLEAARAGLRSLCSRDSEKLSAEQLLAGTLESISENASDSVIAPMCFLLLGGVPMLVFYRAVNTLDAMLGYRGRLEFAGKASARLDDVLNWLPARLSALFLLVAGLLLRENVRAGLHILKRDAGKTQSPNAGWPMAAFAGLLGVQLEKPGHYMLGDALSAPSIDLVRRGLRLVFVASALLLASISAVLAGPTLLACAP